MKLHKWLVKNDEKNFFFIKRAKNVSTLRKRVNSKKETVMGRVDKLPKTYANIVERASQ